MQVRRVPARAEKRQSGTCRYINGPNAQDMAQMPFAGMTDNGFGRFGGMAGMCKFTDLRWVTIKTRSAYPF